MSKKHFSIYVVCITFVICNRSVYKKSYTYNVNRKCSFTSQCLQCYYIACSKWDSVTKVTHILCDKRKGEALNEQCSQTIMILNSYFHN